MLRASGWLSNSPCILESLRLPTGVPVDGPLRREETTSTGPSLGMGSRADVLRGLRCELELRGWLSNLTVGATCEEEPVAWTVDDYDNIRDNVTGQRLDPAKVLVARTEELEFMDKLDVMTEVPLEQCWLETNAKPVGTKWVDINKGDDARVELRARLVAMELKSQQVRAGISRDDVFSATPPLEAVRLLLSMMMTEKKVAKRYKMMFIDISRAHFHSPARRRLYVELAPERARPGWCGLLNKSMYGTRDAAANFAALVMSVLSKMGFKVGVFNPCLCEHDVKDVALFYHGDDFAVLGEDEELKDFAKELGEALIVKVRGVLGPDDTDVKEITLLNRIIRYCFTPAGTPYIEWEADPRHVEIITDMLQLKRATKSKELSSPGIKRTMDEVRAATD